MALATQTTRAFVCLRCQIRLTRAAPIPLKCASYVNSPLRRSDQATRTFSTTTYRLEQPDSEKYPPKSTNSDHGSLRNPYEERQHESDLPEANGSSGIETIPWYLQEQPEEPVSNPFLERQRLPDLPDDPPSILEPLLQHISVDLGLDYVSFLDLRKLDPPPALGANLIMLFGSARSEKHLNVSADRLCRWLRTNYKLRPTADGLLGRNELKLKLRRKNRRAKLMSAAGASVPSDPDDGITTGWICVDVGTVNEGPRSAQSLQEMSPGLVGFGSGVKGTKIVVQIMTESKRGDLDLESLWGESLNDASKNKSNQSAGKGDVDVQLNEQSTNLKESSNAGHDATFLGNNLSARLGSYASMRSSHVRSFHTFARRREGETRGSAEHYDATAVNSTPIDDAVLLGSNISRTRAEAVTALSSNESVSADMSFASESLKNRITSLKQMKQSVAVWLLGEGQYDRSSTSFLKEFYKDIPLIPQSSHLFAQFDLQCYAIKIGHPGYTREHLLGLLRDMQAAAVFIPEELFLAAFETVLMAHNMVSQQVVSLTERLPGQERNTGTGQALRRVLKFSFEVLEYMESYGYDTRSATVFRILHDAITKPIFELANVNPDDPFNESTTRRKLSLFDQSNFRHQFRRALDSLYFPKPGDNSLYTHLLSSYITEAPPDWSSFWTLWRNMSRQMRPRTAAMYALMFGGVARAEHATKCQEVLLYQFPEMSRESPAVECKGAVASSVIECLIKARVPRQQDPWVEMWDSAEYGVYKEQGEH